MYLEHRVGAIILMGGVGRRFASSTPKQFHRLAGKPIFLHTLEAFISSIYFDEIVLCCCPAWVPFVLEHLPHCHCSIRVVEGGATRQESSLKGLLGFQQSPDIVVVHDAIRPFVTKEILAANIRAAIEVGAVDTCIPSADTLVFAPDGITIDSIPNRSELLRGQTPQSFSYPLLLRAHRQTHRNDATDDCRLVLDLDVKVGIVPGDESNIKITTELDLILAEHLLRMKLCPPPSATVSLKGKRIAIVGGTGGIGRAIAKELDRLGATAIPLSRNTNPKLDLTSPASIRHAFRQLAVEKGPLDGLVNCAGLLRSESLATLSLKHIKNMLDINLTGLILCCKAALLKEGASIVNLASSSFSRGRKGTTVYSATKAAVVNFTQGLAEERPDLRIHAVIPQRTNTPMRTENFPDEDPSTLLAPECVAKAVIQLLQETTLTGLLVEVKQTPQTRLDFIAPSELSFCT